jgi:CyaY protein
MTENEFLTLADTLLTRIEDAIDALDLDTDCMRQGNVLSIEFEDGSKIIVNSQAPTQEMWVAAKSGGFHFRLIDGVWMDTRNQSDFFATISRVVSAQSGRTVIIV